LNATQRALLRSLVQRLLPEIGRERLLGLLEARIRGREGHPALDDPLLKPLWSMPETLGWAHQYAQTERKEQLFARMLTRGEKVSAKYLPAITQLFTPAWVARFLVQNSLGRLWLEMHPDSVLASQMESLLPTESARANSAPLPCRAGEIRLLDPACGAMHLGLEAYRLLSACYQEELAHAGNPGWPARPSVSSASDIPRTILEHNLHGLDIDPAVLDVARRVLRLATGNDPVHLHQPAPPLGALDRAVLAGQRFHVILANPPYLARRHMEPALAAHLQAAYPEGKGDLYAAFLQRMLEWLEPGGRLGVITQSSFLFIATYAPLRRLLLAQAAIEGALHLGSGAFAELTGEKVNTAALVLRREDDAARRTGATGLWVRLLERNEAEKEQGLATALRDKQYFRVPQASFASDDGAPFLYWVPEEVRTRCQQGERLSSRARFCRGISTGENGRFVRYWWEVGLDAIDFACRSVEESAASPARWFPYAKGGGPQRWYASPLHVLYWAGGGRELRASKRAAVRNLPYQFQPGITYRSIGSRLLAQWLDGGHLFDQASNALFPLDPADGPLLLALLNHPVATFTAAFNPTVNIVAADLDRIPWPAVDRKTVAALVDDCIALARQLDQRREESHRFRQPPLHDQADLAELLAKLAAREKALERLIDEGLGWSGEALRALRPPRGIEERTARAQRDGAALHPSALRAAWVGYALSILFGRCHPGGYGGGDLLTNAWDRVRPHVRGGGPGRGQASLPLAEAEQAVEVMLTALLGQGHPLTGSARLLRGPFWPQHQRTYRRRQVFALEEGVIRLCCPSSASGVSGAGAGRPQVAEPLG